MNFWVYLLRCADMKYYTGHTDNLEQRLAQHQFGGFCDFTSRRRPVELVWQQEMQTRDDAFRAEFKIKNWSRAKKEALIVGDWKTLSQLAKPPKERSGRSAEEIAFLPTDIRSSRAKSRDVAQRSEVARDVSTSLDMSGLFSPCREAERFAHDLLALSESHTPIGLAVSGGPDSLALMLLAHEAIPGDFEAATVDHGLRTEGPAEAEAMAAVCAKLGIPHAILRPIVAPTGNLQANARGARYGALGDWAKARSLAAILTAHHADDQAETLLMRLSRGAGVRGLAGMRGAAQVPGHPGLPLLRPLLGWRKAELEAIVARAGIDPTRDPSNADRRFERVRVRAGLATAQWLDPAALSASAAHLAQADAALDWAAAREWDERVTPDDAGLTYRPVAPRAVRLRVIERAIAALGHEGTPRGTEIARLEVALEAGRVATLGGVRGQVTYDGWRFTVAPPRRTRATD